MGGLGVHCSVKPKTKRFYRPIDLTVDKHWYPIIRKCFLQHLRKTAKISITNSDLGFEPEIIWKPNA
jgi:hypothetical protein